jgi:hypothetical protein
VDIPVGVITCPVGVPDALWGVLSKVISVFIICMSTLLLMPLPGLHFCVGLDFVAIS